MDASSVNSSEKKNLFWDTLDSKKGVQANKRERHHFAMILPLQHITTVNSCNSSTVFTLSDSAKGLPTLRAQIFGGFISGVENVETTRNVAQPFSLHIAEVRCWKLWAPQVGSEKGIEFDKGKSAKWNTFCHNKKTIHFAIHLHFSMHFLEYLHVESC